MQNKNQIEDLADIQQPKQAKHFQIDFRSVRPIEIEGGNIRHDYSEIPELAETILDAGYIGDIKFTDLTADIPKDLDREFRKQEYRKRFAGKFLIGGINMPLVGYSKTIREEKLFFSLAGHRRTHACELIFREFGIITLIPFVLKDTRKMSELDILTFMLNENQSRVGLTILEQASLARRMKNFGADTAEICARFNKKRDYLFVTNLLKLDSAPDEVKEMIKDGTIKYSNVLLLMEKSVDSPENFVKNLKDLKNFVEEKQKAKGDIGKVKIKIGDINKAKGNVDSKIELTLFFRKYKGTDFPDENLKSHFLLLQKIAANQITVGDLERFFNFNK